jgi:hypothetical protein
MQAYNKPLVTNKFFGVKTLIVKQYCQRFSKQIVWHILLMRQTGQF